MYPLSDRSLQRTKALQANAQQQVMINLTIECTP